jgi:hypothetical protein
LLFGVPERGSARLGRHIAIENQRFFLKASRSVFHALLHQVEAT